MNEFRRRFGQLIRDARVSRSLTQAQLAGEMRLDQPTMSQIEHGEMRVPVELAFRLMDRLQIKPDTLLRLGRSDQKTRHQEVT